MQETEAAWGGTAFNQDQDGKVAAKFRKLMGINMGGKETGEGLEKGPEAGGSSVAEVPTNPKAEEIMQKQHELFEHLDKEYEYARMTTHTHRGVGLGFASHVPTFPKWSGELHHEIFNIKPVLLPSNRLIIIDTEAVLVAR